MGIIEETLSSAKLNNKQTIIIEKNVGNSIHVHVDNFRFVFSKEEFEEFVNVVMSGKEDLLEVKDEL